MTEKGEVIGITDKLASVRFIRTSACGNCTACGMGKNEEQVIIDVQNTTGAKVGDLVDIEIETKKAMSSSAIAYVFPLIMLIVGAVLGVVLGNAGVINLNPDMLGALFGIGFTVIAYLIIRFLEPVIAKRLKNSYKMVNDL